MESSQMIRGAARSAKGLKRVEIWGGHPEGQSESLL